jgi:hypothetical protein
MTIIVTKMHHHNLREYRFVYARYGIVRRIYTYNVKEAIRKAKQRPDGDIFPDRIERGAL